MAGELEIAQSQERAAPSALQSLENEELRQARLELELTVLEAPFRNVIASLAARKPWPAPPYRSV